MRFARLSLVLLSVTLALTIQADPLIYIKNNSVRLISIKPLANYTKYEEKMIEPDSGEIWEYQGSSEPINGLYIRYCPGTPETDDCNNSLRELQKVGKSTTFTLTAPDAKKYYLKVDIDANNTVLLEPQKGIFGSTTGAYKYSLKGNIKANQIKEPRTAPTQRMPLPSEAPSSVKASAQNQKSLVREIETMIQNGPAEFAKPADQRIYKRAPDFHRAVMEKIKHVQDENEQERLKGEFGVKYAAIPSNYPK